MKTLTLISLLAAAALTPAVAQKRDGRGPKIAKPRIEDTIKANVYADNWFQLYINGELIATDSIKFIPHNVVSVDVLPRYPMTIAVMAKDNADAKTGMEYNNTQVGDGGFILEPCVRYYLCASFFARPSFGNSYQFSAEFLTADVRVHIPGFDTADGRSSASLAIIAESRFDKCDQLSVRV